MKCFGGMAVNKSARLIELPESQISKALAALAIERILLKIGKPVLNEVTRRLYLEYKCYIPDCHDHPEFLKAILKDLYGASHVSLVESINKELEDFTHHESIRRFADILSC